VKKKILSLFQILISLYFIYLTSSNIDWINFKNIIQKTNYWIVLAPVFYFLSQVISSERLRYILTKNNFKISFKENGLLYLIGMFYNFFVPGGIGGEFYKSYLMKKSFGWNLKSLAKILIQDRAIGLGVLLILMIVLENNIFFEITITSKVVLIFILIAIGFKINQLLFGKAKVFKNAFLISLSSQFLQICSILVILFSLGIKENYFGVLFVFITTSILSVFSVGGVGIREYIFIVASQTIDISQDLGATIGILFTISASICCLPGFFIRKRYD